MVPAKLHLSTWWKAPMLTLCCSHPPQIRIQWTWVRCPVVILSWYLLFCDDTATRSRRWTRDVRSPTCRRPSLSSIGPLKKKDFNYSTGLLLARTRWVRSIFSSHCPFFSHQRSWLTLATSINFPLKFVWECWEPGVDRWEASMILLFYAAYLK